jgi:predicted aminopeptidase
LDVSVRTANAFSTLGWFNDPLTKSLIELDEIEFVATLFHELFHATIWINGQVSFNESFANAFGYWTALEFFKNNMLELKELSKQKLDRHCRFSKLILTTKTKLNDVFTSNITKEEKSLQKEALYLDFKKTLNLGAEMGTETKNGKFNDSLNNAYFIAISTYYDDFDIGLEYLILNENSKQALIELQNLISEEPSIEPKMRVQEWIKKKRQSNPLKNENLCHDLHGL